MTGHTHPQPDNEVDAPLLGLATTGQLLDEIRARIEVDYYSGGGGLGYTTVGGRPDSWPVALTGQEDSDELEDGAKVTYSTLLAQREGGPLAGVTSTAYLDGSRDPHDNRFGVNKHTDESLLVHWDDKRQVWLEVDAVALYRRVVTGRA